MMVTPYLWLYMVVITLGLFQKQFLTVENRHFFNPSNFALIMALAFFYQDAHIVLGQLGDTLWLKLVLVVVGLAILMRAKRWVIPLGFTIFYLLFEYILVVTYDPVLIMEEVYHRFYSVSFILFILFMLTDPKTTPTNLWQQLGFALVIAFGSALLDRIYGFRVQHLFMILFILSTLVPLLTNWQESREKKSVLVVTMSLFLLALSVIIHIQSQAPYYFEMDS
ncbi:MAG: RnfABCDGE type electron transport complex subunit D [Campylobacterota bacterium]|nr:RnfABCDGE type electron transport complex subunit D [Campylobacterota bacterium]